MAITTVDGVNTALPGQVLDYMKTIGGSIAGGSFFSLWSAGSLPSPGVAPGAAAVPTSATLGAARFTNPASGITYLADVSLLGSNRTAVIIYDRLVHSGGLSGTVTTAQNVNTPAITRGDTTGADADLWLEVYGQLGTTSVTATVSYTNTAGTAGRTGTATVPVSPAVGFIIPVGLQAGDSGASTVQTVTLSATTGTAGNFGVTIGRRLVMMSPMTGGLPDDKDWMGLAIPQVYDNACIALASFIQASGGSTLYGSMNLVQG